MKIFRFLAVALFLAGLSACATTKDLNRTQADLDQKIKIVDEKVISADQTNQALKKDVDSNRASVTGLLKRQADTGADLTEIREQMQLLRGRLESMQKDDGEYKKSELTELRQQIQQLRSQVESLQKKNEEFENSKQRLDQVALKIKFLNDYLGIDENSPRGKGAKGEAQAKAAGTETSRYAAASALFKDGKYGQARSEFQSYLKTNPKAADAAKAQFLIGETYYFEKDYERAILEYEKVIKNYSGKEEVANALFKQGVCFQKLGDKGSARLLFQQVIKEYPNTSYAGTARAKLSELK